MPDSLHRNNIQLNIDNKNRYGLNPGPTPDNNRNSSFAAKIWITDDARAKQGAAASADNPCHISEIEKFLPLTATDIVYLNIAYTKDDTINAMSVVERADAEVSPSVIFIESPTTLDFDGWDWTGLNASQLIINMKNTSAGVVNLTDGVPAGKRLEVRYDKTQTPDFNTEPAAPFVEIPPTGILVEGELEVHDCRVITNPLGALTDEGITVQDGDVKFVNCVITKITPDTFPLLFARSGKLVISKCEVSAAAPIDDAGKILAIGHSDGDSSEVLIEHSKLRNAQAAAGADGAMVYTIPDVSNVTITIIDSELESTVTDGITLQTGTGAEPNIGSNTHIKFVNSTLKSADDGIALHYTSSATENHTGVVEFIDSNIEGQVDVNLTLPGFRVEFVRGKLTIPSISRTGGTGSGTDFDATWIFYGIEGKVIFNNNTIDISVADAGSNIYAFITILSSGDGQGIRSDFLGPFKVIAGNDAGNPTDVFLFFQDNEGTSDPPVGIGQNCDRSVWLPATETTSDPTYLVAGASTGEGVQYNKYYMVPGGVFANLTDAAAARTFTGQVLTLNTAGTVDVLTGSSDTFEVEADLVPTNVGVTQSSITCPFVNSFVADDINSPFLYGNDVFQVVVDDGTEAQMAELWGCEFQVVRNIPN